MSCSDQGLRLPPEIKIWALEKLVLGVPFHHYSSSQGLIDLQRYLKVLAEALRSFGEEDTPLQHDLLNEWYAGINNLDDVYEHTRKITPAQLRLERWDVAFLLKHCPPRD